MDLNQGLLHLCSKFGDSSSNEWWVIVRTSPWLTHTHGHTDTRTHRHTDAANDNTRRPKLASGNDAFSSSKCIWKCPLPRISAFLWGESTGDWIAVLPNHHSQLHLTENFEVKWVCTYKYIYIYITAFTNANMTMWHKYITLQWRYMNAMMSQITDNSTVVSTLFRLINNRNKSKAHYHRPFVRINHR